MESEEIQDLLLRKMHRIGAWGTHHISESNLQKSFPAHLRGKVIDEAEKLRKQGLLVKHPSSHDRQWWLNWNRKPEIDARVKKFDEKQ